ncbi:dynein light chain family protein [Klebsiella pneumoniae]
MRRHSPVSAVTDEKKGSTITLQAVNELIASLEGAGELSIKETKVMDLAKAYQQLAAENVALKAVFSEGEIPSEAVDAFMETAVMDHDWNETSEWSWVENETEVIHAILNALKPDTTATDRIVAGIKADEEKAVLNDLLRHLDKIDIENLSSSWELSSEVVAFVNSRLLREGADK